MSNRTLVSCLTMIALLTGGAAHAARKACSTKLTKSKAGAPVARPTKLRCTLISGDRSASVVWNLDTTEKYPDAVDSDQVEGNRHYDISFALEAECEGTKCKAGVTFFSRQDEDEAGSLSFEFSREKTGEVFREPVTGAPDGRDYLLRCEIED